jgi:hypothetical protein
LRSLASIHHDYESKQYEQQKLKTNLEVSDIMTDNLWNAIQRNNNDDGYGFLNTMPELDLIEKGFEGNFDGYFLSVKHWKKNKVDPFELEERRINKTNDR